jgi:hypothetical protein
LLRVVTDIQQGKWIPRRNDADPKNMNQVQMEAQKAGTIKLYTSDTSSARHQSLTKQEEDECHE